MAKRLLSARLPSVILVVVFMAVSVCINCNKGKKVGNTRKKIASTNKQATKKDVNKRLHDEIKAGDVGEAKKDANKRLYDAVHAGNIDEAKKALTDGADSNYVKYSYGYPHSGLLFTSANQNNLEMAKLLLDHGADVNATSGDKPQPALASAKSFPMIKLLVEYGADVNYNIRPKLIMLVLDNSFSYDKPIVEYLLAHGADININYFGMTPLKSAKEISAKQGGLSQWEQFLIEKGSDTIQEQIVKQ